jgi:pimeloyl-ACP methyl ester carboxylesterase
MTATPRIGPIGKNDFDDPAPKQHIGRVVAGSLFAGLVVGLLLVAAPFIEPEERDVTGALLLGFAVGWGMLAVLSGRFTDQPQRWAAAPATFMGVGGLLLMVFDSAMHDVLDWVWPPALLALVVWMISRARRHLHSRSRRRVLYPVFAILALASVGAAVETVWEAVDGNAHPAPGQLIDVGDHKLHLSCTGSGSPTVVLEPGAGDYSPVFGWIAPVVSRDTRVCVYDRAGRGWSEPANSPQDAAQIATDLHTLLERGDVPGPYVLAGHSFGGLYALTFAARHPDDMAGMVLVDSTVPASADTTGDDAGSSDVWTRASALLSTTARLGLGRLYSQISYGSLPPQSRDDARATGSTASRLRSTIDEYVQGGNSTSQASALGDFDDKPLVVLTAGEGSEEDWITAHDRLADMSTNSAHRMVDGASHSSMLMDEGDAAKVTQAILDVVSAVRSSGPVEN